MNQMESKSSAFEAESSLSPSEFLLTAAPAPRGNIELVTLENDELGEKAPMPTKIKTSIRISTIMLKAKEIAMSRIDIPSCSIIS